MTDDLDYLELFSLEATGETVAETMARERAEMAAEYAARKAAEVAARCPRCAGEGRLSQFSHFKSGKCFLCGGSGVFAGYKG